MARRRQITVPIANLPGTLAGITEALGKAGVNVEAFTVFEGQAHLLVDKNAGAIEALREARYPCLESEVLFLDLDHRPGALARAARTLAGAGVNIDYAYSGSGPAPGRAFIVMSVSDLGKAEKLSG
jgi:hypothetical protein